jgi:S-adenosylmethionine:tRNA ribosyltransferase-isomerase
MRVDEFDFDLPTDLIADRPAVPRDAARLLVVRDGAWRDQRVNQLPAQLRAGDLLVHNDTRVMPARLHGLRGQVRIEITLISSLDGGRWRALARPAKRLRTGDDIVFAGGFSGVVDNLHPGGQVDLILSLTGVPLANAIDRYGEMPLPPYITRLRPTDRRDREDYQTVYAARDGAVAAPTAGLHFTPRLLDAVAAAGMARAFVTLHVGPGTFLPVRVEETSAHRMQAEWGEVSAAAAVAINRTRRAGGRIVAIGTTSLRLIETAAAADGVVAPFAGETDLFIAPGYRFRAVDVLLTNFHLPRSTLFMLVSAFAGLATMRAAYAHAVAAGYLFYSYGDACLLKRAQP